MRKTIPVTFGDNVLNFTLPDAWDKLEQWQLRYVCYAMSHFDTIAAKTYIFIRLLNITVISKQKNGWTCSVRIQRKKVRFFIELWQLQSFLRMLDFIDVPGTTPICLQQIGRLKAVNVLLHMVPFKIYIDLENYYQGYLHTHDSTHLQSMGILLYVDENGTYPDTVDFTDAELLSIFLWFAALKNRFAILFSHFFHHPDSETDTEGAINMIDVMNAEIRALTGGDITKENQVLNMDCWRALTELNEKAREAKEMNEKYGHK